MNIVDIKLFKDANGQYDIGLTEDGDIAHVESFDTAILMSLFAEKRADSSEVIESQYRRGWWGNVFYQETDDLEMGSKNWLLEQARLNQDTVNRADDYTKDGFSWFVASDYLKNVETSAKQGQNNIEITVDFIKNGSKTESKSYNLWQNTGDIA